MRLIIFLLFVVTIGFWFPNAASAIGSLSYIFNSDHELVVTIDTHGWDTHPGTAEPYKVCALKLPLTPTLNHIENPCKTSSSSTITFSVTELVPGDSYKLIASCRCKHGFGNHSWRYIDGNPIIFARGSASAPSLDPTNDITSTAKRLKFTQLNECVEFRNDEVISAPCTNLSVEQAFEILNYGSFIRIMHLPSFLCLSISGGEGERADIVNCADPLARLEIETNGLQGPAVRVKGQINQSCLYTTSDTHQVHHWGCWLDPAMTMRFDPY